MQQTLASDSHVPPVLTKTWFHTGAYLARTDIPAISNMNIIVKPTDLATV